MNRAFTQGCTVAERSPGLPSEKSKGGGGGCLCLAVGVFWLRKDIWLKMICLGHEIWENCVALNNTSCCRVNLNIESSLSEYCFAIRLKVPLTAAPTVQGWSQT